MDGDDAVQTRAPPALDEQLLVVDDLQVGAGQLFTGEYTGTVEVRPVPLEALPLPVPDTPVPPDGVASPPVLAPVPELPAEPVEPEPVEDPVLELLPLPLLVVPVVPPLVPLVPVVVPELPEPGMTVGGTIGTVAGGFDPDDGSVGVVVEGSPVPGSDDVGAGVGV
jgi:hypothetical protein